MLRAREVRAVFAMAAWQRFSEGNVLGVITNTPGRSFSSVAGQLIQPKAWNKLEGSVARWDNSKVLMAQTAMSVPGFIGATPKPSKLSSLNLPEISWEKFSLPKFDREAFEFGEIDMSTMRAKFENLRESSAKLLSGNKADKVITPKLTPGLTPVPKLRGMSKVPNTSLGTSNGTKLKAWAADKLSSLKSSWNNREISNSVKAVQAKATPIGDMIKEKFGLDPSINSNALATMIMALLATLFLLLGLAKPSRKR